MLYILHYVCAHACMGVCVSVTVMSIPTSCDVGAPQPSPTPSAPIYIFPSLPRFFHPLSMQVRVYESMCVFKVQKCYVVPVSLIPAEWIWLCASHTGDERIGWGGRAE